jgi:hypothetical protein
MSAVWIFRAIVVVRGCWWVLEWLFDWLSSGRDEAFSSLHPYVNLFAHATGTAVFLAILAGLWFFRRLARLLFVLLLGLALVYGAVNPHRAMSPSLLPSFVPAILWFMDMLNGVIVAMSFLPPVRDMFAEQT